jgi:hypothetical protein
MEKMGSGLCGIGYGSDGHRNMKVYPHDYEVI